MLPNLDSKIENLFNTLYQNPEPSGKEEKTTQLCASFFKDNVHEATLHYFENSYGFIAEMPCNPHAEKALFYRVDLDAVPVNGISHACGHHGHMSIAAQFVLNLQKNPIENANVFLLFQPSEENAVGAKSVLEDPTFKSVMQSLKVKPYFFALHNVPGYKEGQIVNSKTGVFSSAVISHHYKITSATSDVVCPEFGIPIAQIVNKLPDIKQSLIEEDIDAKISIVHAEVDENHSGELCVTFRAHDNTKLNVVLNKFDSELERILNATDETKSSNNLSATESAITRYRYEITGSTSHAAYPELGHNPIMPIAEIIHKVPEIIRSLNTKGINAEIIIGRIVVGKNWNGGTCPADGELCITFLTNNNENLSIVLKEFNAGLQKTLPQGDFKFKTVEEKVDFEPTKTSSNKQFSYKVESFDYFPATENTSDLVKLLTRVNDSSIHYNNLPFSWGEDFGWFLKKYSGIMFGLGSGKKNTGLHTETYRFPKRIIAIGANIFYQLAYNATLRHSTRLTIAAQSSPRSTSTICAALQQPRRPELHINLGTLAANIDAIINKIPQGCELMAVIKDNFYGLGDNGPGSIQLIAEMSKCGISLFCVARFDEAIALRRLHIQSSILVLEEMMPDDAIYVPNYNLIPTLTTQDAADALQQLGASCTVHVKLNTGSNLNGVEKSDLIPLLTHIKEHCSHITVEGLYTHFNNASDDGLYFSQLASFKEAISKLEERQLRPPILHAANSYTTFYRTEAYFDRVRCGAALFGIIKHPDLSTACSLKTRITRIRYLKKGDKIGYNQQGFNNRVAKDSVFATILFGYGDGGIIRQYDKDKWPHVLINGQKAPIFGEPNMDKLVVDITDIEGDISIGDEVTIFDEKNHTFRKAAASFRKIPAEFLAQLSIFRCARCYNAPEPEIALLSPRYIRYPR